MPFGPCEDDFYMLRTSFTRPLLAAKGLPPLPSKYNHRPAALKVNNDGISCRNSTDLTDDGTEDCTLTTTDDDDPIESTSTANRYRRLAMARAHSCPSSPTEKRGNMESIRTTGSTVIAQETDSDIDEIFEPFTSTLKSNGDEHALRERKQSRYSRAEIAGATYSVCGKFLCQLFRVFLVYH